MNPNLIPIKEFQVDFTPQVGKKTDKQKQKDKAKPDFKKKRPLTGKVQAIVEDSKSLLQKMMKTNKPPPKQKSDYLQDITKSKPTKSDKPKPKVKQQQEVKPEVQFNADTFLKTQKQKQKQYAKQLHKQFEESKKERMSKLYERQKEANQKISQTKVESKTQHKFYDQLPTLIRYPVDTPNYFVLETHQTTKIKEFISFVNTQQLRNSDKAAFDDKYKWQKIEKLCDDFSKLKFVNIRDNQIQIKNDFVVYPTHDNLLSVLGLISLKPELLEKLTLHHEKMLTQRVYPFLFYKNNKKVAVIVDNYIQSQQSEFGPIGIFSHSKNKNTAWIPLFEKAYRKLFKQIGPIHQVCSNVLNVFPEIIKISSNAVIKQNIFQVLRFHIRNGGLVGMIKKGDIKGSNSYQGRIYPVKEVRIAKTYQDSSMQIINPWYGKSLLSDGRQHLNPRQIFNNFNRVILIKDYPLNYIGIQYNVNMYSFGIAASNNPEWVKNHQYLINVNKSSLFRVILKRTNDYPEIFGFSLVKCQPEDTKITAINLDKLITTVRSTLLNEASYTGYLEKGSYMLLPFTHKRSEDSYVFLKLEIYTNNADNYSWGKSKVVEVEYKEISRTEQKVEGDLEVIEKYQRPKPKSVLEKGEKRYFPDQLTIKDLPTLVTQNPQYKPQQILIPGLAHRFITKQNIAVQQKPISEQQKLKNKPLQQIPQIQYQNRNQQLKILLGIDAYTEQVDKQMFDEALQHLDEEVDFNNYELGDEGFQKIIEYVLEQPRITVLNLKGNMLTDKSIVLLCYFLEKSDHSELKKLNLADNKIGAMGFRALEGLTKRIKVKQVVLTGNSGLKVEQIKRLSDL